MRHCTRPIGDIIQSTTNLIDPPADQVSCCALIPLFCRVSYPFSNPVIPRTKSELWTGFHASRSTIASRNDCVVDSCIFSRLSLQQANTRASSTSLRHWWASKNGPRASLHTATPLVVASRPLSLGPPQRRFDHVALRLLNCEAHYLFKGLPLSC